MDAASASARRRFASFIGVIVVTAAFAGVYLRDMSLSPQSVRAAVLEWGALAPLVYVGMFSLRPFLLFPSWLLFITAGLAFGPMRGTLYAVIGGTIAAVLSFLLARWLGREFVQARLPKRLRQMQQESELGAGLIFVLNMVPIVPMTPVHYGAGLSRVSFVHYTLAVMGGLTPRALAYSMFGDALLDVGSRQFMFALAGLVALVLLPALGRRWWMSRLRQAPSPARESER